jgi:hypothetical protein
LKPVKQEVNSTVILPPSVFPDSGLKSFITLAQVVVGNSGGDGADAKHKRRRRSRGSTLRDDDGGHSFVKPPSREIGIQVEMLPPPKKSPGRWQHYYSLRPVYTTAIVVLS